MNREGSMARGTGRIDRRKLKQPDEFITWSAKVFQHVRANRMRVSFIAGGVLLVIIIVFAYRMYRVQRETRASSMVSMAIAGFADDPTNSAPFERIIKDRSGTRGARLAGLYLAHSLYRKGEIERAAKAYRTITEDSAATELIRTEAILGRGYSLVALKRCEEAEAALKAVTVKSSLIQQRAYLAIGRCYELKGDSREAIKRFQEFAGRFPQSPFLTEALRRKIGVSDKK